MATKKKRKPVPKPFWERGYNGHVYWLGKAKLGKVSLIEHGGYEWSAAGRSGRSDALPKAKSAVETAVAMADRQLPLFET